MNYNGIDEVAVYGILMGGICPACRGRNCDSFDAGHFEIITCESCGSSWKVDHETSNVEKVT